MKKNIIFLKFLDIIKPNEKIFALESNKNDLNTIFSFLIDELHKVTSKDVIRKLFLR
jgi:hypothetical protein